MECIAANRRPLQDAHCWSAPCLDPKPDCFSNWREIFCKPDLDGSEEVELTEPALSPHDYMSISSSADLAGPWKERVIFVTDPEKDNWACNKSNPSPIFFPNGRWGRLRPASQ